MLISASVGEEEKEAGTLEADRLAALLQPGGAVARLLPGFETRPGQLQMLLAVCRAFSGERLLACEAGTGVGKSLAYGLPAAEFALEQGERVAISSATINLQEQLVGKDLPLVAEALGGKLEVALVKGRQNFLCRRRLAELGLQRLLIEADFPAEQMEALLDWARRTDDGSRSGADFPIAESLWEAVASDGDACAGKSCQFRRECFFFQARRRAARANLLVVNHHLLCAHLALVADERRRSRGVLPAFSRLVIDEAHELEDAASSFFGVRITALGAQRLFSRLVGRKGGLLVALAEELRGGCEALGEGRAEILNGSYRELSRLAAEAREAYQRAFLEMAALVQRAAPRERKLRLEEELGPEGRWAETGSSFRRAADLARRLAEEVRHLCQRLCPETEEDSLALETMSWCSRAAQLAEETDLVVSAADGEHVRWLEAPGGRRASLHAAPLEVASRLDHALFSRMKTVVLTSATLEVGGRFDFLAGRLGLDRHPERLETLSVPSPFDFAEQARLVVPLDLPAPTESSHETALEPALLRALAASSGRALVLFTSWRLLGFLHQRLRPRLETMGLEVFCQGERPRDALLRGFRKCRRGVLFGTDSFWQGVDVVGEALRQVIITRLPFDVPSEPLARARGEQIAAAGGSAFRDFFLPRAVLKLKQGFGRLIRSRSDWGAVTLLDNRLLKRSYGARFLESLPPATRLVGPLADAFAGLESFFAERGEPGLAVLLDEFSGVGDDASGF